MKGGGGEVGTQRQKPEARMAAEVAELGRWGGQRPEAKGRKPEVRMAAEVAEVGRRGGRRQQLDGRKPGCRVSRLPARSSHALWHDRRHGLAHAGETGNAARSQGLCQRQVQHREMRGPKSVRHDTRKRGPDFMSFDERIAFCVRGSGVGGRLRPWRVPASMHAIRWLNEAASRARCTGMLVASGGLFGAGESATDRLRPWSSRRLHDPGRLRPTRFAGVGRALGRRRSGSAATTSTASLRAKRLTCGCPQPRRY